MRMRDLSENEIFSNGSDEEVVVDLAFSDVFTRYYFTNIPR